MDNLNTKEYWDTRFEENWLDFEGDKQSAFFASIFCELLPETIKNEFTEKRYSICDMGCAMGDGTQVFSRKLGVKVDGADFSPQAVDKAKGNYPECDFFICDINTIPEEVKYDVILCSNVLEHFASPWSVFHNFSKCASKYIIILVPYRENIQIDEHMYRFREENIPLVLDGFMLCYTRTVDGKEYENSYYPDQQILLVYRRINDSTLFLSEITKGTEEAVGRIGKRLIREKEAEIQHIEEERVLIVNEKDKIINQYKEEIASIYDQLDEREAQFNHMYEACCERDKAMAAARDYCYQLNGTKSYKISLLVFRFFRQVIKGDRNTRRAFWSMMRNHHKKNEEGAITKDDSFNILVNVAKKLSLPSSSIAAESTESENMQDNGVIVPNGLNRFTWDELRKPYQKVDIIFFSVISYDFRFQRPQQFAKRFAENGHRVFYVNADFNRKDSIDEISNNLYVVNLFCDSCTAIYFAESDKQIQWITASIKSVLTKYAVCDAVMIVDYPNWVETAISIREEFGFRIVTDYMDDYTGFMTTSTDGLKDNCIRLLGESDSVVASSSFLNDIALKYARHVSIIRNGTEVNHFIVREKALQNERPVIGYYGAISDWFDWKKIVYLANNLPDCDIVLIGEITKNRKKFEKYKNIKLLGEKQYRDLPEELAKFDVCLIPFDTSTDLIKATNPVKFYEYLSAGKKIVATEIPELVPYKDQYVYMSNDDGQFLEYVKKCISRTDDLKDSESCVAFARENDWQKRYEAFADCLIGIYPRISIVILTYNNLRLNKECIQSVLEKTAYPNYELIVVDNCSSDGTRDYLEELNKKNISNLRIIFNEENSGFAGGNNKAIEKASGDYIVLLNNDTVVTRGWLTNFLKHFIKDPKAGMVGAVTNSIGNEAMIAVHYKNKDELLSFAYQYMCTHRNQKYTEINRVAMFGVMIRRDIINEYGALDISYKVGMFEDDDYAMVVKDAGYEIFLAEDVFIHHVNNASFNKLTSLEYKRIFETNKKYYEKKWKTKWVMPHYRKGVEWNTNEGMMVEPK